MIMDIATCPKCQSKSKYLVSVSLLNNECFIRHYKCRHCTYKWNSGYPLFSKENKYQLIWLPDSKITKPLHRWVWEQYHKETLSDTDAIHHINRNRGDNRPSNLLRLSKYEHNGNFHRLAIICKRCGHRWLPKAFRQRVCPKCKSPYWDKERV